MKSYTDIEQSKKLAEYLSLESSDMLHCLSFDGDLLATVPRQYSGSFKHQPELTIPCWSLAALLDVYPMVVGRDLDMFCCWQNHKNLHSKHYDNPIDACCEMIIKLHEQKML